ncbi:MAG TPA: MraY family glycosyltransferase [Bryobacteraceae bacterium]|nr:MraY family glycosyltransferase [Bryobacteraceae bacterium]HTF70524.1 MraY family glycosyltransferase [Edaphobacter sp.]
MLLTLLLLTALSLILSLLFTPAVRILALRCNLVDLPDNKRKVHKLPIPRVGGVALAAAYFGSLVAVAAFFAYQQAELSAGFAAVRSIAPAALVIFFIGLADDIFNLKPWHKFAAQIAAAGMVVSAGVQIHGVAGFHVHPILLTAGTIVWLVACTNAVNLIDGLDGLAAGISLLATLTVFIASLISGNTGLAIATAPLAGALLGFLVFNFNPASIFLGDSGSLFLGFLLGCYSILWSGSSLTVLDMTAPFMVLAVPLIDTTLAIARRFLRRQPIFKADRSHVHHRLLARGLSHRGTVLLLYVAAGIAGTLSLCLVSARDPWQSVVLATFACAVAAGIWKLGYAEFDALRCVIFRGDLRREITAHLTVQTFEEGLKAAESADDCWAVIQDGCKEFGLHAIRMQLAGHIFAGHGSSTARAMRIPISENDWIELSHTSGPVGYPAAVVPLANAMRRVLADKSIHAADIEKQSAVFSAALFKAAASTAN